MNHKLIIFFLSVFFTACIPSLVDASQAALRQMARQAGIPDSAAGMEIVRQQKVQQYKEAQARGVTPEQFISGQGQPAQLTADQKKVQDELLREIAQLKALLAAGGGAPGGGNAQAQKEAIEKTEKMIDNFKKEEATMNDPGSKFTAKEFGEPILALLDEIAAAGNPKAALELYTYLEELSTHVDQRKNMNVATTIGGLVEKVNQHHYIDKLIMQDRLQKENEGYRLMAEDGKQSLANVLAELQKDPSHIRIAPLDVYLFLPKKKLDLGVVGDSMRALQQTAKRMPLEDLKALFTYFYQQKIMPNKQPPGAVNELMGEINSIITSNKPGAPLQPAEFDRLFKPGPGLRASLTNAISNIDGPMKTVLTNAIEIAAAPPVPVVLQPEYQFNGMTGEVTEPKGMSAIVEKLTSPKPLPKEITKAVIAARANMLGGETIAGLKKGDKVKFNQLNKPMKDTLPWIIIGDVEVTEKAAVGAPPAGRGAGAPKPKVLVPDLLEVNKPGMEVIMASERMGKIKTMPNRQPGEPNINDKVMLGTKAKVPGDQVLKADDEIKFGRLAKKGLFWEIEGAVEITKH